MDLRLDTVRRTIRSEEGDFFGPRATPLRQVHRRAADRARRGPLTAEGEALDLDAVTAAHIRRMLGMTGGKIHGPGGAGELLGVNPNTLRHRMRKLGIPFRKDLRAETV